MACQFRAGSTSVATILNRRAGVILERVFSPPKLKAIPYSMRPFAVFDKRA